MLINNKQTTQTASYVTRRIGGTVYKIKVCFNETATETMEDKILRMVRNEALSEDKKCGTIKAPQMSRPV